MANGTQIQVVTEEAFPLQYSEEGVIKGPTTQIVKQMLAQSKVSFDISIMPWARAYEMAKQKPNTLIYSIARTPSREDQFHWIGIVSRYEYYLYTTKDFADSHVINEQTMKQYRIGSVRNSATFQYLHEQDFQHIFAVSNPDQNYEKLIKRRIDMFPASRSAFEASCKNLRDDCERFIPVIPLGLPPVNLYVAMSKETPIEMVNKLKSTFQNMKLTSGQSGAMKLLE